jgi:hypothetical protein
VPLIREEDLPVGVLCIDSPAKGFFDDDETVRLMKTLGRHAASAIALYNSLSSQDDLEEEAL